MNTHTVAHPCALDSEDDHGRTEFDHDWKFMSDLAGDCDVVGGMQYFQWKECKTCGMCAEDQDSSYDDSVWR
jgi:hypothetical protein